MVLSFVLVSTLVTVVSATPHGYGVKGGASAKAEASAVAGALGPIPLSIPSGAGFSGSFSKSSSSSFASSSASSSASSYSFSGSGINGVDGIGAGGSNHKGCTSGICPGGVGAFGPLDGGQQFTGANAVAEAQAKALSGSHTPCQGSSCNGSPAEKCSNGQCSTDSESKVQNECSTGNCASKAEKPLSGTGPSNECLSGHCNTGKQDEGFNDSNDFAVNINQNSQSKSHDLSNQHGKQTFTGSDCSGGKCGPGILNPNNVANKQNQHPAPATYLTTPNHNQPCTTPNCNSYNPSQSNNPSVGGHPPSSYNVPIQSATNSPSTLYSSPGNSYEPGKQINTNNNEPSATCTSPSCKSALNNVNPYNLPDYHIGQQKPGNHGPCLSGRCDTQPSLDGKPSSYGAASGIHSPNYLHGSYPSNVPSGNLGQQGCKTPNCSELPTNPANLGSSTDSKYTIPTYSSFPVNQQNKECGTVDCASTPHTSAPKKPADAPVYSGGFGGPPGFLDLNAGGNKPSENSDQFNHHGHAQTQTPVSSPTGVFGHSPTHGTFGVTKPSELNPVNNYSPTHTSTSPIGTYGSSPVHGSFGTTNQNELISNNQYGSTYTPSTSVTTGDFGHNKPSGSSSTPGTQFNPSHVVGAPLDSSVSLGPVKQPDSSILYKPSTNFPTGSSPAYTGSAGLSHSNSGYNAIHGSFGLSNTGTAPNSQSSPTYTGGFGGPTGGIDSSTSTLGTPGVLKPGSGNCGIAGCNGSPGGNINGGTTFHDTVKPSADTSSQNKPAYSGGFGGPTGLLKPNDFNVPANTPTSSSGNPCTTGKCSPKVTPSATHNHGHPVIGAQGLAVATANANAVAYSGGFGGPPGVLKPYDDGKVKGPAHANLGSQYSPTADAANPNANDGHQSISGKNSLPGSSSRGENSGARAIASASASAGSYSGNNNYQNNNGGSSGCNSGCPNHGSNGDGANIGHHDGAEAGSVALAKSVAGANAFGGSFASSSASAHASAGAATKGGYGKK